VKVIVKILVVAVALWVATKFVQGITLGAGDSSEPLISGISENANKVLTLIAVALIFGIVNAVIKPIVKTVGCAFYVLTLGLIALVVNALLLLLTSWIAGQVGLAFNVAGFVAAFWGAIIIAVVSWLLNLVLGDD
jgi:putative membrane protein